jgi:hypothetical protein
VIISHRKSYDWSHKRIIFSKSDFGHVSSDQALEPLSSLKVGIGTVIAFAGRNGSGAARRGDVNVLAAISVPTRRRILRLRSMNRPIPLCTQWLLTSFPSPRK